MHAVERASVATSRSESMATSSGVAVKTRARRRGAHVVSQAGARRSACCPTSGFQNRRTPLSDQALACRIQEPDTSSGSHFTVASRFTCAGSSALTVDASQLGKPIRRRMARSREWWSHHFQIELNTPSADVTKAARSAVGLAATSANGQERSLGTSFVCGEYR